MKIVHVICAIIRNENGEILLLRRKKTSRYYPASWGFLTGTIEQGEKPEQCAVREAEEEISCRIEIKKTGYGFSYAAEMQGERYCFTIYPMLCKLKNSRPKIKLNNENVGYKWLKPEKIIKLRNVLPLLKTDLQNVGLLK